MDSSSLWDRYHHLLQEYIAHGDEDHLRKIVALSQERGLTLETTSGRVAASVRAVLSAYASIGAESMVVDVHKRRQSHEELREASTASRATAEGGVRSEGRCDAEPADRTATTLRRAHGASGAGPGPSDRQLPPTFVTL